MASATESKCTVYILGLELVSKDLNHNGVIAGLFRQIGGHSSRFVPFCSFWRLFTKKIIKSIKVFPFSFWKIITKKIFLLHQIQTPRHKHAKWPPSDLTPWTLTLGLSNFFEPEKVNLEKTKSFTSDHEYLKNESC